MGEDIRIMSQRSIDAQHRISRSRLLFIVPLVLLGFLLCLLTWAVVSANVNPSMRKEWPWRLTLLDVESLSNILAVTTGLIFARAQYARTVCPIIAWTGEVRQVRPGMTGTHIWVVEVHNGSSYTSTVEEIGYQCWEATAAVPPDPDGDWVDHGKITLQLQSMGIALGRDFDLNPFAHGGLLGGDHREMRRVGRFSSVAIEKIGDIRMRVRVVDVVGDHHERVLLLLRGARTELESARAASGAASGTA
ncbi:hypothetical protein [Streptacidiphilus sp. PAMC 29251]